MRAVIAILLLAVIAAVNAGRLYSICYLPEDGGEGYANFRRYFYNSEEKSCKEFVYGGMKGNANRFETWEECMRICGGRYHYR